MERGRLSGIEIPVVDLEGHGRSTGVPFELGTVVVTGAGCESAWCGCCGLWCYGWRGIGLLKSLDGRAEVPCYSNV